MALFKWSIRFSFMIGFWAMALIGVARAETTQIVGLGDSLMAGYQLPKEDAFPVKLEVELKARGHDVAITNAGVSGDTTSAGLARLDWSIPDETDLVIVELGGNDALRGITPEITRDNIDKILARLKERGIAAILAGMQAPPNLGSDYAAAFNTIYTDMAAKYEVPLYPFFLDGVIQENGDQSRLLSDGIHPNGDGTTEMAKRFAPIVEEWLTANGS